MTLKQLINKSVYGTVGYISSQNDLDLLEQYIVYNLPVLKEFKKIIVATNYEDYSNTDLILENYKLWAKYFSNCSYLDNPINRGHSFGTADLDDSLFDYCKKNNIEWLCKSANDIILQESILNKEIKEADFYYLCGFGYAGFFEPYNYSIDTALQAICDTQEFFYPQTNFYFINVSKVNYLNDKNHVNEIYSKVQTIPHYDNKAWEYGFRSCETLLKETVEIHNLSKYHLISKNKYVYLLNLIKNYQMHDSSHKNIMIDGICHYQNPNQQIIEI
jgi:hypothetical protein